MRREPLTSEEEAEWNRGLRGAYNYTDLNRLCRWIEAVAEEMKSSGHDPGLGTWKEWHVNDTIFLSDIERIRSAVETLRDGLSDIPDWREILHTSTMTMDQANNIEWDLRLCAEWVERLTTAFLRSGQPLLYSGFAICIPEAGSVGPVVPPAPEEYYIVFNPNGGYVYPSGATTVNHSLVSLPVPSLDGYDFQHWSEAQFGGTTVTTSTVFLSDGTIWAQWKQHVTPPAGQLDAIFANNSWAQIAKACRDRTVPASWVPGDVKPMEIGGKNYNIRILGKGQDVYRDGQTAPLSFEMSDLYSVRAKMNPGASGTGWEDSDMRANTLPGVLSAMPAEVRDSIQEVKKITGVSGSKQLQETYDKLWLKAEKEVFGFYAGYPQSGLSSGAECNALEQYQFYEQAPVGSLSNRLDAAIIGDFTYWLRSPHQNYSGSFCTVTSTGAMDYSVANAADYGISACFCF